MNHDATLLAGIFLGILLIGSITGAVLQRTITSEGGLRVVENLVARVNAWWLMSAFIGVPLFSGKMGTLILFGLASFFALREFITLTPTRRGDHRVFFWAFFIITPLQYWTLAAHWIWTLHDPHSCLCVSFLPHLCHAAALHANPGEIKPRHPCWPGHGIRLR